MIWIMNSQPHRPSRHRHSRQGRLQMVALVIAAILAVALVGGLFWLLTSPRFANSH
jgi:heme/copper-type cytochrome/quinol oxidase subunit 4